MWARGGVGRERVWWVEASRDAVCSSGGDGTPPVPARSTMAAAVTASPKISPQARWRLIPGRLTRPDGPLQAYNCYFAYRRLG
jgi:hypothetical protein